VIAIAQILESAESVAVCDRMNGVGRPRALRKHLARPAPSPVAFDYRALAYHARVFNVVPGGARGKDRLQLAAAPQLLGQRSGSHRAC
jgi:hypothetical protein